MFLRSDVQEVRFKRKSVSVTAIARAKAEEMSLTCCRLTKND